MTKLSFSLENKNPSSVNAKGGAIVEIDQDYYKKANDEDSTLSDLKDPEFEMNGTNGLSIEEPVVLQANVEPLPLSYPILINQSEVVVVLEDHVSFEHKEESSIINEKKYSASSFSSKFPPLWGLVSICGRRRDMEDSVIAMPRFTKISSYMLFDDYNRALDIDFSNQELTAHVFGVYDGHGGCQVANFCRERLHHVLAEEIKGSHTHQRVAQYHNEARWREIFANCFRRLDDEVSGVSVNKPICSDSVGSTAVVAVVCPTHVIVGNCGDSRAVLCRGKEPVPLSVDHKPEREDECERIEASGGRVINWDGYRVSGVLAVSRSIGDRYLRPYVISDPEVTFMARTKEDECLILASDGLWDVITNKEACEIARRRLVLWHKKNGDNNNVSEEEEVRGDKIDFDPAAQEASEYLSKLALKRGSRDNISVIVVDLKAQRRKKTKKKMMMMMINKDVDVVS